MVHSSRRRVKKGKSRSSTPIKDSIKFTILGIAVLFIGASVIAAIFNINTAPSAPNVSANVLEGYSVTLYATEGCSCCHEYAKYLQKYSKVNLKVEIVDSTALSTIKDQYNLADELRACHTTVFKNFFVEGHVNLEAIAKFVEEGYTTKAQGLILPGMPAGSPGMGGVKTGYTILIMLNNGDVQDFMDF